MLFTFLLLSCLFAVQAQDCTCTEDGISNGVQTDRPGCILDEDAETPKCFVQSSRDCPTAIESNHIPGAFVVDCSFEDALFFAAETDDLESIERFRERGITLVATPRLIRDTIRGSDTFQLVAYAAAYGSFRVVEDLLINGNYICGVGVALEDAICRFSDQDLCTDSQAREAILSLINFTYRQECGEEDVFVRPVPSRSSAAVAVGGESSRASTRGGATVAEAVQSAPASCDRHPYFVSIRSSFSGGYAHRCGGVLVEYDTVMTAAHCVDESQGNTDLILVIEAYSRDGGGFCNEDSDIRKATKIVAHPKWFKGKYARSVGNAKDVALLKLNKPSTKQPIQISSEKKLTVGERLRFVGMGRTSSGSAFAQELNIVSLKAAEPATCKQAYPQGVASGILCVGGEDGDFCEGDDGGPLFKSNSTGDVLVGIAHLKHPSAECGTRGIPGLYANVAKLRKWINKTRTNQF